MVFCLKVCQDIHDIHGLSRTDVYALGHGESLVATPGSEDNIVSSNSRFRTLSEHEGPKNLSEKNISVEVNRQDYPMLETLHTQRRCPLCSNLQEIVGRIIEGLCGFQSELSVKLASESVGRQARVVRSQGHNQGIGCGN